jgi:hypothetical protein
MALATVMEPAAPSLEAKKEPGEVPPSVETLRTPTCEGQLQAGRVPEHLGSFFPEKKSLYGRISRLRRSTCVPTASRRKYSPPERRRGCLSGDQDHLSPLLPSTTTNAYPIKPLC